MVHAVTETIEIPKTLRGPNTDSTQDQYNAAARSPCDSHRPRSNQNGGSAALKSGTSALTRPLELTASLPM